MLAAWVRDPLIQVQVESPAALPRLAFIDPDDVAPIAEKLGRRSPNKVAIVKNPVNPDLNASVWVAADYQGYKNAYLAFLRIIYQIEATAADLAGFDVDHLLNRARSPSAGTFIRVEAVPRQANQDWGRLFERTASDPRFFANQNRERRTMSYVIAAKLAGQLPPLGPNDLAGVKRLALYFASIGIPLAEAQAGVTSMLDFAYKFR